MKIRYEFETIDGTAYSTLDIDPDEAVQRIWEAAEKIGYSCTTAKFVAMSSL